MTKEELMIAIEKAKITTRDALQTVYNALNTGQQKQLIKNEAVKNLFDLHGVVYEV